MFFFNYFIVTKVKKTSNIKRKSGMSDYERETERESEWVSDIDHD